jgi:error-prone DNA polymerase
MTAPAYAELQVTTNFSFLRGASHAHELAATAAALGHKAIAVADRNTLAGVVRMHIAAKEVGIPLVVGARLDLTDGASLLAFPRDRAAYGRLARLITLGRRRAPKGDCDLARADVFQHGAGMLFVLLPPEPPALPDDVFADELRGLAEAFPGCCYLAAQNLLQGDDDRRLSQLAALAEIAGVPLVATNDVHMHTPARRPPTSLPASASTAPSTRRATTSRRTRSAT